MVLLDDPIVWYTLIAYVAWPLSNSSIAEDALIRVLRTELRTNIALSGAQEKYPE